MEEEQQQGFALPHASILPSCRAPLHHLCPGCAVLCCREYPAGMHVLIKGFVTNMPELMSASGAPRPLCLLCLLCQG